MVVLNRNWLNVLLKSKFQARFFFVNFRIKCKVLSFCSKQNIHTGSIAGQECKKNIKDSSLEKKTFEVRSENGTYSKIAKIWENEWLTIVAVCTLKTRNNCHLTEINAIVNAWQLSAIGFFCTWASPSVSGLLKMPKLLANVEEIILWSLPFSKFMLMLTFFWCSSAFTAVVAFSMMLMEPINAPSCWWPCWCRKCVFGPQRFEKIWTFWDAYMSQTWCSSKVQTWMR